MSCATGFDSKLGLKESGWKEEEDDSDEIFFLLHFTGWPTVRLLLSSRLGRP